LACDRGGVVGEKCPAKIARADFGPELLNIRHHFVEQSESGK